MNLNIQGGFVCKHNTVYHHGQSGVFCLSVYTYSVSIVAGQN